MGRIGIAILPSVHVPPGGIKNNHQFKGHEPGTPYQGAVSIAPASHTG
jgi:hypothetical protein